MGNEQAEQAVTPDPIIGTQHTIDHARPETRYAVDGMSKITVDDLLNNPVGIKTLMLDVQALANRLAVADGKLKDKEGVIESLKTSPFVAIVAAIMSAIGAIIVGIGQKQLAANLPFGYTLLTLGGTLIISSSLANILFPWARKWFNK